MPPVTTRSGRVVKEPQRYEPTEKVTDDYDANDYDDDEPDSDSDVSDEDEDESEDEEEDADQNGNLKDFVVYSDEECD
jgi:hypothetical protein